MCTRCYDYRRLLFLITNHLFVNVLTIDEEFFTLVECELFPLLYNFLMYYIYGLTILVSSTIQLSDVLYLWIDNTCFLYYTTF